MERSSLPLHPSIKKIWMLELLCMAAEHLPWWALFMLRFYPVPGPKVFVIEVKRRVYSIIAPFVVPEHPREFFQRLSSTDGIVFGSIARHLLLLNQTESSSPILDELSIAVGEGRNEDWFTFFTAMGYMSTEEAPEGRWIENTRMLEVFTRVLSDGTIKRVSVYIAKKSAPLRILLGSPSTADMHGITSNLVFSFYPRLVFANEGLLIGDGRYPGSTYPRENVCITDTNSHWKNACGPYCPTARRKTYGDDGYASYIWNVRPDAINGNETPFDPMNNELRASVTRTARIGWTVLPQCYNEACGYKEKFENRSEYVNP